MKLVSVQCTAAPSCHLLCLTSKHRSSRHSNGNYLPVNMLGNKNHDDFQMIITTSEPYKMTIDNSTNTI